MKEDLHKLIEAAKAIAKENSSAYNEIKKSYVEKEIFRKDSFMKFAAEGDVSPAVDGPNVDDSEPSVTETSRSTETSTEPEAPSDLSNQKVPKLDPDEFIDSQIYVLLESFWNIIDGMKDADGNKIKDLLPVYENSDLTSVGIFSLREFLKKIKFREVYVFTNSYTSQNVQYTINSIYNSALVHTKFNALPPDYLQRMCKELNTYIRSAYKSLYPPQNQEQLQSEPPSVLQRAQESVGNWSWLNTAKGILNNILD
jgi:hypothetical protein